MRRLAWIALLAAVACGADRAPPRLRDAGPGDDGGPRFVPVAIPALPSPEPNLFGVWGSSDQDVFLVGERGTIVHYDGASWTVQPPPVTADLRDVWGTGPNDVYAVGNAGTVLHYTGGVWRVEPSTTTADLYAVGGTEERVFAAGAGGVMTTKNAAGEWILEPSGTLETILDLWMDPSGRGVAVGTLGALLRFDGTSWSRQRIRGVTVPLAGVFGTAPNALWVVGLDGTILRSSGAAFEAIEGAPAVYLRRVFGAGDEEVFITGWGGVIVRADAAGATLLAQSSDHRLEGIWGTTVTETSTTGELVRRPRYYVVGVTGTVLVGP